MGDWGKRREVGWGIEEYGEEKEKGKCSGFEGVGEREGMTMPRECGHS